MGGLFGRYSVHPSFAIRLGVSYGTLYATDQYNYEKAIKAKTVGEDPVQRYFRYQDIKSKMWEGNLTFEFEPLRLNPESRAAKRAGQPYVLAGIGYFHYTPYSSINGTWVKVNNLHLEGDGFPVSGMPAKIQLGQVCVPLGIGYKFDIGEHLNIGLEYEYRMTMTDYLDGVSNTYIDPKYFDQNLTPDKAAIAKDMYDRTWVNGINKRGIPAGTPRGNPSVNDSYSTISLVFFWKFKNREGNWWE